MKYRIFYFSLLLVFGYMGCNSPSAHYDIDNDIEGNNLSGNWQVTLDITNISEMPDYSFFNFDPITGSCENYKLNPEFLNPDEIVEILHILKGHQIGVTMDLYLLNNEHHYDAALSIADFKKDILANMNEQMTQDFFEIYNPAEADLNMLSMPGVFDENELRLFYEMDSIQMRFIGELINEEGEPNTLAGDFSWSTELFTLDGKWKATQVK